MSAVTPIGDTAWSHPARRASRPPESDDRASTLERRREDRSGYFLIGSVALHVLGFALFAAAPEPARASALPTTIDIELTALPEEVVPEPEMRPEPTLAEGTLDAPLPAVAPPEPSATAPKEVVEQAPVEESPPAVLAAENPYADPNFSFSAAPRRQTEKRILSTSPLPSRSTENAKSQFGVEGGSKRADAEQTARLATWYRQVSAVLRQNAQRDYPKRAQRLRQQGTAQVHVMIDASGRITSVSLAAGSGHELLDRAALAGIRAVGSVPAPPAGWKPTALPVPVTFRLR